MNDKLKELQQIELDILMEFDRICTKNNISYFLVGGSLLGCIRHKGFIPWDDDIDVGMLREEYDRFVDACKKDLDKKYFIQDMESENNCGLVFGKIRKNNTILSEVYSYHLPFHQGIWIDIFPYDNVCDNKWVRKFHYYHVLIIKNLYIIKCGYKNPHPESKIYKIAYIICKIIVKPFSLNFYINRLDKLMKKYNHKDCEYAFPFGGAYPKKDTIKKNILLNVERRKFEKYEVLTLSDYDTYLKQLYGDYMTLPPIEKRTSGMHNIHDYKNNINEGD